MSRHPEVRKAFLAYVDAQHHAQYAALYSSLGLSPEQIRQMDITLRLQGGNFGMMLHTGMATFSAGPDYSNGAVYELPAQLTALIGDAGFQQFEAYGQTIPARIAASNLASLLVETDSPLTSEQTQQLIPILTNAGNRMTGQFDWTSVLANAQDILSAPQMEMLKNLAIDAQGWHQMLSVAH